MKHVHVFLQKDVKIVSVPDAFVGKNLSKNRISLTASSLFLPGRQSPKCTSSSCRFNSNSIDWNVWFFLSMIKRLWFRWSMKVFWCEPFASHSIEQKAIHVLFRKHDDNDEGEKDVQNRLSLQSSSWKIMGQKERETGLNFFHLQLKGESIQGVSFFVRLSSPNNFSTDSLPMKPQRLLVGQESLSLYYCDTKWGVTMKAIESFAKNAKQRYLFSSTCKWSTQEHSRRERLMNKF